MTTSPPPAARTSVLRLISVILLARTVLNIGYRAVYPFLPDIAAGLGVSFESAAEIIQSRNLVGLLAPLFGPLSDHYGRRTVMLAGLGAAVLACLALGLFNSFTFAVIAIAVIALGKAVFDPAQQAYLGDRIPYAERGRAISLSEISWSAAALLGLPLLGIVVQYAGWRAGFVLLGIVGIFMLGLTRVGLAENEQALHRGEGGFFRRTFGQVLDEPVARAILLTSVLSAASNENIGVVYAEWLKLSFQLDAVALGVVASVIGAAELCGELFSSRFADRVGKQRLVSVCLLCSSGAYAILPLISASTIAATQGLFITFFFFEISVVAAIPLISEAVPTARATLLALNVAAFALGRTLGSFAGPYLLASGGFALNSWVSAGGALATFAIWSALVRERAAR